MPAPKMIGSMNARIGSFARIGRRTFTFDGTTLDLTRKAIELGATEGALIHANYGGMNPRHATRYRMVGQGGGNRTEGGLWVDRD